MRQAQNSEIANAFEEYCTLRSPRLKLVRTTETSLQYNCFPRDEVHHIGLQGYCCDLSHETYDNSAFHL